MTSGGRVLVTGGAGFIGSYLVEELHQRHEVQVLDTFADGEPDRLPDDVGRHEVDLLDVDAVDDVVSRGFDVVYHLAAEPDVQVGVDDTRIHTRQNVDATLNLLEAMLEHDVTRVGFTSTSTVYGEDVEYPTPESYGPLEPISLYGASKLGAEGLMTAFAGTHGFDVTVFRLANIVGGGGHGVVPDFVRKLQESPEELEILGDGRQRKSYLHVSDCVAAIRAGVEEGESTFYNVGSEDTVSVTEIAEIVSEEMDLDPEFSYTGGERGWKGDVPRMRLSVTKLQDETSWSPGHDSRESVRKAAEEVLKEA